MVTAVSLGIIAMFFFYTRDIFVGARVHYPGFGIRIPVKYRIHGIDVSRYQKSISWDLVKDMQEEDIRIGFVFMKATEGADITDRVFHRNWKKSGEAGLIRGAYHYFLPSVSAEKQAAHFIKTVQLRPGDLPPVLDVEEAPPFSNEQFVKRLKTWLNVVEAQYGVKPILYASPHFYRKYLANAFDDYPLWIAHYETDSPRIGRPWHFWQHNERGRVDGIDAFVDFNVFAGDSMEFGKMLVR